MDIFEELSHHEMFLKFSDKPSKEFPNEFWENVLKNSLA